MRFRTRPFILTLPSWKLTSAFTTLLLTALPLAGNGQGVTIPPEAILSVKGFELAPGLSADVYAAEPLVANPVAIHVDEDGNVFVCETFRQQAGVEDNRDHEEWVDDDLAARTVADRLALLRKHLKGADLEKYRSKQERIRMLSDQNRDGQADRSTVFVDGFRDYVDGTGAGVLARKGSVYYTCIPKLYAFRDDNGDGKADRKSTMFDGFGVRFAYRGHDLHGLCMGPDHRLYFTIGDRGYNVKTENGIVADPESGAVFRCEMDGSNLEVIATGLRNPQELAFDELGNLFTCDNNSDSGDLARWLNIVEGGEYGWRMAYQYFGDRGPWNREALWDKKAVEPAAYVIPPIENFCDGPAGLAYYPGTGLSPDYNGNFFLCDFRGQSSLSGIRTFKVKPDGASFKLIDPEIFLWNCLATDVCFAPDGSILVSDWVEGWVGTGKGRIYRLRDAKHQKTKAVAEVAALLAKGMTKGKTRDLATLLAHVDQRVRLEAQFELARRFETTALSAIAKGSKIQLAQVHAVWGLGEIGRQTRDKTKAKQANEELVVLLRHPEDEVRAAATKVLGDNRFAPASSTLTKRLYDDNPRLSAAAAIALSRIADVKALPVLIELVSTNADDDPIVRHSAVMAIAAIANDSQLRALSAHPDKSVRLAGVLAARRQSSHILANYLGDKNTQVVREAARAINDLPVPALYPQLAKLIQHPSNDDTIVRRALNAHHHLGTENNAQELAKFAADVDRPVPLRQFAFGLINNWESESPRDRVTGQYRPLKNAHLAKDAAKAVKDNLTALVSAGQEIRIAAANTAARMGIKEVTEHLVEMLWDEKMEGKDRAGAMLSLGDLHPNDLEDTCLKAVKSPEPRVRAAGRIVLAKINPDAVIPTLREALSTGSELEKQSAVSVMASVEKENADRALLNLMTLLKKNELPDFLRLDVVMAAEKRGETTPALAKSLKEYRDGFDAKDPISRHRDALVGGNAERGKNLFEKRLSIGCVRCHQAGGDGGNVGPNLAKIAGEKSREYLLESIVVPNKSIAKGFDTLVIITNDGKVVTGVTKQKTEDKIILMTPEGKLVTVDRENIDEASRGKSAMPDDLLTYLTPFDLRDLIEYLATLK